MNKEDFFDQTDSLYVRIFYVKEEDGFKFQLWNNMDESLTWGEEKAGDAALNLGRGMLEITFTNPGEVSSIGARAIMLDEYMAKGNKRFDILMAAKPANDKPI